MPPPLAASQTVPEAGYVKEKGLLTKVLLSDIHSVAADNKICTLHLAGRSVQVRMSLRELASILPAERFIQIQRSYFINNEHIERPSPSRHLVPVGK